MDILRFLNQPGWDYRLTYQSVNILAPTKADANQLAEIYGDCLFETAAKIKGKVCVGWRRCKNPIEFFGWMSSSAEPTRAETAEQLLNLDGGVFSSLLHLPVPLLKRMVKAGEDERPISIVRQRDKKQIIINEPMQTALQTPAVEATQRLMVNFWRPRDLAYVDQQFFSTSNFRWQYDAALRPDIWAILESEFERFEVNGQWYGQTTFLIDPEPIPFPEDVVIRA